MIFNVDEGGTWAYAGTATTGSAGIATLGNVSLAGLGAGSTEAVMAVYSGDSTDSPTTAYGTLSVTRATPVINWSTPSPITYGNALGSSRRDATRRRRCPARSPTPRRPGPSSPWVRASRCRSPSLRPTRPTISP